MKFLAQIKESFESKTNQLLETFNKNNNKLIVFLLLLIFLVLPLLTSKPQEVLGVSENATEIQATQEQAPKDVVAKPEIYAKAVKRQPSDAQVWEKFDVSVDAPNNSPKTKNPTTQSISGKILLGKENSCGFASDKFFKGAQVSVSFEKKREIFGVCEVRILPPDVLGVVSKSTFEKLADPNKTQSISVNITY